jgi:hypothetical protein
VVGVYCGLLCSEWWEFIVGYCAASGGSLLWVIVQRVVGVFTNVKFLELVDANPKIYTTF